MAQAWKKYIVPTCKYILLPSGVASGVGIVYVLYCNLQKSEVKLDLECKESNNGFLPGIYEYDPELHSNKVQRIQDKNKYSQYVGKTLKQEQADDLIGRIRALHPQIHHGLDEFTESDYVQLAQTLDPRILVKLARTEGTDERLFLKPRNLSHPHNKDLIDEELHELLLSLPRSDDEIVNYFTDVALADGRDKEVEDQRKLDSFGHIAGTSFTLHTGPDERREMNQLRALASHSEITSHCVDIIKHGGLRILQRIVLERKSLKMKQIVAGIIANLAIHEETHESILKTDWIHILGHWIRSPDLELASYTAKALANLDPDADEGKEVYKEGIHLLHPQFIPQKSSKEPVVDVVCIHGLLGGPFKTWRQKDAPPPQKLQPDNKKSEQHMQNTKSQDSLNSKSKVETISKKKSSETATNSKQSSDGQGCRTEVLTRCWPKDWLAEDCPHIRVLAVSFDSYLSEWGQKSPYENQRNSLEPRGDALREKLLAAGVGNRPVIWVGHSMGGLLIKQILVKSQNNPECKKLVDNTLGTVFFAVPHRGSALASMASTSYLMKSVLSPSQEVEELIEDSELLKTLHSNFTKIMEDRKLLCQSLGETVESEILINHRWTKTIIVPEKSSNPGFGTFVNIKEDHINLCKPKNRTSEIYTIPRDFICNLVNSYISDRQKEEKNQMWQQVLRTSAF